MTIQEDLKMFLTLFIFYCLTIRFVLSSDEDLFSSTHELHRLLLMEMKFSRDIHKIADLLEDNAKIVRKFADLVYPNGPFTVKDPKEYVMNPVNALGVVRRLGYETSQNMFLNLSFVEEFKNLSDDVVKASESFPTYKNYEDSVSSLGLLQETYNLDQADLAKGIIK